MEEQEFGCSEYLSIGRKVAKELKAGKTKAEILAELGPEIDRKMQEHSSCRLCRIDIATGGFGGGFDEDELFND